MSTSSVISAASSSRETPVSHPMSPGPYKTLTPSPSVQLLFKTTDDDLRRKGPEDLLHMVRHFEADIRSLLAEHSSIIKDVNRRTQINMLEIRGLKDINQKLQDDNQELRDLCCFLDDDRQRSRKLAREWQRFGRYTASVMRSEVSAYQEKLKDLEMKQDELISDNAELKELCLYLDQERLSHTRDDGDGSSSSTAAGNEDNCTSYNNMPSIPNQANDSRESYVQQLEEKIKFLEEQQVKNKNSSNQRAAPVGIPSDQVSTTTSKSESPSKPEAVVRAMKVLEVHELLERPQTETAEENLGDKEKAIVREMCNVVWRKLGDIEPGGEDMKANYTNHNYENIPRRQSDDKPPMPPPHRLPPQPPPHAPVSHKTQQVRSPPSYYDSQARGTIPTSHPSAASKHPPVDYPKKPVMQISPGYNSASSSFDLSAPVPGTSHTVHAHAIPSPQQYRSPPPPPPHIYDKSKHTAPHVNYQHNYYQERPFSNHPMYNAGMQSPNQAYVGERLSQETLHHNVQRPGSHGHAEKDQRFARDTRHHLRNDVQMQSQGDGRHSHDGREHWDTNVK